MTNIAEVPVRRRSQQPPSEYSQLLSAVQATGLFRRRYLYYSAKIVMLLVALAGIGAAFALIGHSWAQLAVAAAMALVLTQIVFLSHDAAHRQIFHSHRANEITALLLGTLVGGVSLSWWNNKHNKHHAAPNQIGKDPDIDASRACSSTRPRCPATQPLGMFLREHQGWWFFPLLLVEALNLHAQSVQALITRPTLKRRWTELAMLTLRLGGYPALLFLLLPPAIAATFLGGAAGGDRLYLGSSFAASHIGMPVLPATTRDRLPPPTGADVSQRLRWTDGLVRHGRAELPDRTPSVSEPAPTQSASGPAHRSTVLRDSGITYHEVNILQAWALVAAYLNKVGLAGRDPYQCPMVSALRPR